MTPLDIYHMLPREAAYSNFLSFVFNTAYFNCCNFFPSGSAVFQSYL